MGISLCLSELARQKPLAGHNGAIYETVESYQSNGYVITAIRHPELLGKFPLRYRFSVLDENGNEAWFIALGSYESLTKISQELGAIDTNQRIYHLSEYRHGAMETYGFYENEPPFDQLKEMVTSIVAGQSKKLASASTGPDSDGPGQAEINQAIGTFRELMGAKKYAEAVKSGELAIVILENALGGRHPSVGKITNEVGIGYYRARNVEKFEVLNATSSRRFPALRAGEKHMF